MIRQQKDHYKLEKRLKYQQLINEAADNNKNKFGLEQRLNIKKEEKFKGLSEDLRDHIVNKRIVNGCQPLEIQKTIIESDMSYQRMLGVNRMVDHCDFKDGAYVNEPEVLRGAGREERGKIKEKFEAAYMEERKKYEDDQAFIEDQMKRYKKYQKRDGKINVYDKIEQLKGIMKNKMNEIMDQGKLSNHERELGQNQQLFRNQMEQQTSKNDVMQNKTVEEQKKELLYMADEGQTNSVKKDINMRKYIPTLGYHDVNDMKTSEKSIIEIFSVEKARNARIEKMREKMMV